MRKEIQVGTLFLVAALLLAYMLSRITQTGGGLGRTRTYYTMVNDSSGLIEGSGIRVAGIAVGRLKRRSIQNGKARLDIEVETDIVLHEDAMVTMRSLGYLGDRYLDLNIGSASLPQLPEGAFVPASRAATLEDLMDKGSAFLESWVGVAQALRAFIGL